MQRYEKDYLAAQGCEKDAKGMNVPLKYEKDVCSCHTCEIDCFSMNKSLKYEQGVLRMKKISFPV